MLTRYLPIVFSLLIFTELNAQHSAPKDEMILHSQVQIMDRSDRAVNELYKLCKIWGYLKYKHPEITTGDLDWDVQLFSYLNLIDSLSFENLLLHQLPKIENDPLGDTSHYKPAWLGDNKLLSAGMRAYLRTAATFELQKKQQYLEPGRWNITPKFKENKYPSISYDDDGIKLLTLFRYWNIIEYFFPYKDLIDEDWDKVLMEYIPKMLASTGEQEYKLLLLELVCKINDGHGGIHNDEILSKYLGKKQIPIGIKIIDQQAFVNRIFDTDLPLEVGDEILVINGEEISALLAAKRPYIPASTKAAKLRILSEYILRTNKDTVQVKLLRGNSELHFMLPTQKYNPLQYVQRSIPSNREISSEIVYIYPGALKPGELESLLTKYKDKASIIFDYRSYPTVNIQNILPNFLLPVPQYAFKSSQYSKSKLGEFPFSQDYKWGEINESYYKGNFVILVNEYTQSQPEFEILIYRQAPSVTIIGSSTAGAIGNWIPIFLPGNILTSISGNGIFRYDESPVQRIGIIPDIYLVPTVEGIKAKRDEVLEAAIKYCEGN
ncbi:MAG: hypothetical protein HRU41_35915 [Saprospiraceae bacterium]|nr:hypothetical protein [Saprospiraceae bacterium]